MLEPVFQFGDTIIIGRDLLIAAVVALVLFAWLLLHSQSKTRAEQAKVVEDAQRRAQELEARLLDMSRTQSEITGQVRTMSDVLSNRQSELMRGVNERLDGMGQRLNSSVSESSKGTQESLSKLQERLAVIDRAQTNITELSGQVVQLQQILANKQTRGAFGQMRMETIVADGLPNGAYSFQSTLTNNTRPDCIVFMPNDAPSLVIDAKFPLEAYNLLQDAPDLQAQKHATSRFKQDVDVHIKAIADKYFIKGETQDTAFMFVPSESVFAAIHEQFEDLVKKAHRSRIVIVSPSLLMLSIQVVQAILKDARMRELAHVIQAEVAALRDDTLRLDDRVNKLQTHFRQANKDIDDILISTNKVVRRSQKIEDLEVGEIEVQPVAKQPDKPTPVIPLKQSVRGSDSGQR
ncbi:DNA recombination protein RmuC [Pararhizobium sp. IMCC21322]|uniref:DNA recombination protein RmuC n=1 Tax=Pararhizobium sp. IMCC21322 TaxID=3067903 RepID=UPI003531C56C